MSEKTNEMEENIIFDKFILLFNLMILNVMWFICSIPIVTIGASSAALNYTCIKLRRDEGDSIVKMFFHSFALNVRQGMVLGTGMLAILIILFAGLIQALGAVNAGHSISVVFAVILVLLIFMWIVVYTYLFMVLSRFDNSIFRTIINSIYFIAQDFFRTLKVLGIECFGIVIIPMFLLRYVPYLFPIVIFIGMPLLTYITAGIFNNEVFADYIKTDKK